jgi:uncharacterized protein YacL
MNKTLLPIRIAFLLICAASGWLVCFTIRQWDAYLLRATLIGALIGALVILVDLLLKGFSLRGLSAITFGIAVGMLISFLLSISPLFEYAASTDPQTVYLFRLALFVVCSYLATVIALRGKDEFNLVIPYVRFVPHDVDVPLVVVDTSALIDGRVAKICAAGFINSALVIPRFVLAELQRVADSTDPLRQARGRRGLDVLNDLRQIKNLDLRIHESEVSKQQDVDAKLVFLAQSLSAKLLTTDYNLARMAEFHGVQWLNLNHLAQALHQELMVGDTIEVDLVKPGKEEGQAVGFLDDGSMVVVGAGRAHLGRRVSVAITSVLPSAGGKMIFARLVEDAVA